MSVSSEKVLSDLAECERAVRERYLPSMPSSKEFVITLLQLVTERGVTFVCLHMFVSLSVSIICLHVCVMWCDVVWRVFRCSKSVTI
jgi:hypothetical protein